MWIIASPLSSRSVYEAERRDQVDGYSYHSRKHSRSAILFICFQSKQRQKNWPVKTWSKKSTRTCNGLTYYQCFFTSAIQWTSYVRSVIVKLILNWTTRYVRFWQKGCVFCVAAHKNKFIGNTFRAFSAARLEQVVTVQPIRYICYHCW